MQWHHLTTLISEPFSEAPAISEPLFHNYAARVRLQ